jgi:hypothetical protein
MWYFEMRKIIKVWKRVTQPLCRAIAPAWPVALSVALLFPVGSPARAQEIEINVTFDQYFDRVLPSPALTITHYDMHVYFSPNGDVVHSERKYVGRGLISRIDESFHIGRRDKLEWLKVDKDTLTNVYEYKSFRRAIVVKLRKGICLVQIAYELKAGFSDYQYTSQPTGVPAVARAVRADRPSCAIGPLLS